MRELKSERSGRLTDASYDGTLIRAFLPRELPPEPPLALTPADENLIARANQAIGRLEGIRSTLPGYLDVINRGTELGAPAQRSSTTEGATTSRLSDIAATRRG
jgi:hypothetical protein